MNSHSGIGGECKVSAASTSGSRNFFWRALNPESPLGRELPVGASLLAKAFRQQAGSYRECAIDGLIESREMPIKYVFLPLGEGWGEGT
jgi:hypothetical protein